MHRLFNGVGFVVLLFGLVALANAKSVADVFAKGIATGRDVTIVICRWWRMRSRSDRHRTGTTPAFFQELLRVDR